MSNALNLNDKHLESFSSGARYINRELSWLAFNERVIEESENVAHPLLERLRFLSISGSNLDEFYTVRAAGLYGQVDMGVSELSQDGLSPAQQLEAINIRAAKLMKRQQACWHNLCVLLSKEGIAVVELEDLDNEDKEWADEYFTKRLFPVLTPLAIDPAHPFPFIPNFGFSLLLELRNLRDNTRSPALVSLPASIPRFIQLPNNSEAHIRFVLFERLVERYLDKLFLDSEIVGVEQFRIVRDSDIELEEEAEDLVRVFESALKKRRRGNVIRLEVNDNISDNLLQFVSRSLAVDINDIVKVNGLLGMADTSMLINSCKRSDLLFPIFRAKFPEAVRNYGGNCFDAIRDEDLLVHHPYESFDMVVQFLNQAARDKDVIAIKQTLYRTSDDSPIVMALIEAAEAGKSVTAVVELNARFDEEANIKWARNLERAGAQVVYGFLDKKTHAKSSLVVRREPEGVRGYVHFGTGNYHPVTAKFYTDISFFTCDPSLCQDAAHLFNYLSSGARPNKFDSVYVAPLDLRSQVLSLINDEVQHAQAGRPAAIWAKLNSLVDGEVINALYEASQAGVKIDLVIRGVCCLRPKVSGLSENIRVKSIVGRFLEHSRIACFGGGQGLLSDNSKVFISSADWMPRNFDRRVEILVPIKDKGARSQVLNQIMSVNMQDTEQSWELGPDGEYRVLREYKNKGFSAHQSLMKMSQSSKSHQGNLVKLKSL